MHCANTYLLINEVLDHNIVKIGKSTGVVWESSAGEDAEEKSLVILINLLVLETKTKHTI